MRNLYYNDIVKRSKPFTQYACVYFLILDDKIVYVGMSTQVYCRINCHSDKEFNKFYIHKCKTEDQARVLETHYIKTLKPKYNKSQNEDYKAPIKEPNSKDITSIDTTEYKDCKVSNNQYIKRKDGYIFNINGSKFFTQNSVIKYDNNVYSFIGALGLCSNCKNIS